MSEHGLQERGALGYTGLYILSQRYQDLHEAVSYIDYFLLFLFFGHLDTNWVILAEDWPVGKSMEVFSSLTIDMGGPRQLWAFHL